MMEYDSDDEYSTEILDVQQDHACNISQGLMVTGIMGSLIAITLSAPIIAIGFIGLWSAGAVAHYNIEECNVCVPQVPKND